LPEVLGKELSDLVVEPADTDRLHAVLIRLASDPDYREDVMVRCEARRRYFDIDRGVSDFESVFSAIS
jgi:hypothetical protein